MDRCSTLKGIRLLFLQIIHLCRDIQSEPHNKLFSYYNFLDFEWSSGFTLTFYYCVMFGFPNTMKTLEYCVIMNGRVWWTDDIAKHQGQYEDTVQVRGWTNNISVSKCQTVVWQPISTSDRWWVFFALQDFILATFHLSADLTATQP